MRNPHLSARASAAAVIALVGCTVAQQPTTPPNTLVAAKVASAPNLAAGAADPAWAQAQPLKVALTGGANFGGKGETTATLKAVYAGDMLYMLVQ
jgi:predicted component of type VI protein secretion system